ncbi:MAG: hypothetical protein EP315_04315 [Gammaproteobacteria bacterium]|nr:MAG: hypothetical protein EP315_04315 [Gammaproteobacteria bacterium]
MAGSTELSKEEAEKLITGNTAEGTNKWGKKMIWYFGDFGNMKKQDDRGNKGKAKWSIDEKGRLCYQDKHMNREVCKGIQPVDGGYEVPFDAEWKWDKVVPGNPHNL